jgi:hypothetical protein
MAAIHGPETAKTCQGRVGTYNATIKPFACPPEDFASTSQGTFIAIRPFFRPRCNSTNRFGAILPSSNSLAQFLQIPC